MTEGYATGLLRKVEAERDELMARLNQISQLHSCEARWINNSDGTISFDSREEAEEYYDAKDGSEEIIEFPLCAECKRLEESPDDGDATSEAGYKESMWPCRTILAWGWKP